MTIKVLVVDDSSFFRRRVSEIVNQDPELEVIGMANNGAEAVKLAAELKPQVITMDIEMPIMDGITAVRQIMATHPTPILMFSSLTHDGAKATLDALDAGALDFLPKRFEDIATNKDEAIRLLQQRVKALGRRRIFRPIVRPNVTPTPAGSSNRPAASSSLQRQSSTAASIAANRQLQRRNTGAAPARASGKQYKLLVIGTSTGGPVALQRILTQFPADYPHPILLVQHMPAAFTPAFASRLNGLCKIEVKEAVNGDMLRPGCAYLAPGGMQMMLERSGASGRIKILAGNEDMNYKPCVDITFASASKAFGGDVLAVILTGMGADGREGARMLKGVGATIWAQDEASCVVYGMPQAVTTAGISSQSISLDNMAEAILRESARG
ncbi:MULTISPECIES: protein-glutamate methylesterase/protein-glutamine glutaminase [Shewanella]|jgi:two-component system chemotaxis response regulator CheB|uniref:Protein-glutamate methylesterase/protein-glutamine glutaminase n=1 Tax=Shewanella chilikensis TaxID=558541 RepID=A0ABX5PLX7_9GAMM|nr:MULTISPECIES: chemotaxis response regulator protein-glutamate methylesterase [Shewanella]MCL1152636.1 chemotaxis response regulator protein-glutamate methylesterase [Shewanella chilikensis]PYE57621.1 response regulator receiver-modulated CheB methylesterase [Shewanella chilikensis]GGZ40957.1 chemotaxis response regulator protein-glutamate methylesterase of group 1 operon [Shewanella chilikensis]HCD14240.1 chemotaxis response regulator protein-glutamate methylesterase [Shewanella sp.]